MSTSAIELNAARSGTSRIIAVSARVALPEERERRASRLKLLSRPTAELGRALGVELVRAPERMPPPPPSPPPDVDVEVEGSETQLPVEPKATATMHPATAAAPAAVAARADAAAADATPAAAPAAPGPTELSNAMGTTDANPDERAVSIRLESASPASELPTTALRAVLAARTTLPIARVTLAVVQAGLVAGGCVATASLRARDAREAAAVAATLRRLTPASLELALGLGATTIRGPVVHTPQETVTAWAGPGKDAPTAAAAAAPMPTGAPHAAPAAASPSRTGGLPASASTTPLLQLAADFRHAGALATLTTASAAALASGGGEREEEEAERRIALSRHAVTTSESLNAAARAQPVGRDGVLLSANFTIIEPVEPFDAPAFASRLASLLNVKSSADVEAESGSLPPPFPGASIVTAALLLPCRGPLAPEPAHAARVLHSKREELDTQLAVTLLAEPTLSSALVSLDKVQLHAQQSGGGGRAAEAGELPQSLIGPRRTAGLLGDRARTGAAAVVRVAPLHEAAGMVRDVTREAASVPEANGPTFAQERSWEASAHETALDHPAPVVLTAAPSAQLQTHAASTASPRLQAAATAADATVADATVADATAADATAAEEAQLRIDLSVKGSLAAFDAPAMVSRLAALIGASAADVELISVQANHAPRSSQRAALAAARATAKAAALVPEGAPAELAAKLRHIQEEARDALASAEGEQKRPDGVEVRAMARVHRASVRLASAALGVDASALGEGLGVQLLGPAALRVS